MRYSAHPCQTVSLLHDAGGDAQKVEFWGTDGDGKWNVMRASLTGVLATIKQDQEARIYGPDRDPATGKISSDPPTQPVGPPPPEPLPIPEEPQPPEKTEDPPGAREPEREIKEEPE